jgi:glutamate synthase (NADPH/NADH) large chain
MVGGDAEKADKAIKHFIKGVGKGLLKVMSKMGISTYMSYTGAQIFEAIGLQKKMVDKYFTGTSTQVEGIGVFEVMEEAIRLHKQAFGDDPVLATMLDAGGEYAYRVRGEEHMWTPDAIAKLQHSTRSGKYETYKEYAKLINDQSTRHMTLRGLFEIKAAGPAVPLAEVEPAKEIVKRFATGAMSLGSISTEAHSTLAIAMNRLGGKSNTGEGGEDPARFKVLKGGEMVSDVIGKSRIERDYQLQAGDSLRSAIKQVASGRFGVTAEYLVNADQLQIKMAQGAKPGEGGQLPGHKVSEYIGFLRHSVPGVGLISPPPHHDIYSIEDLAQLIHDLKKCQPEGVDQRQTRVGGRCRHGGGRRDQGQGRSSGDRRPRWRHRRQPAVVDQARRIALGTGSCRDAADAGAQPPARPRSGAGRRPEQDRARRPDRCPARRRRVRLRHGAAGRRGLHHDAQVPPQHLPGGCGHAGSRVLRRKFSGQPEHVVNYFFFVAEEVRELMAQMGIRSFNDLIGRCRSARHAEGHRTLEGAGARLQPHLPAPEEHWRGTVASMRTRRTTVWARRSTTS